MSYTDPTNEELENYMPFKALASIGTETSRPTWEEVNDAMTKLAANARSVPSDYGDGLLGHSFIIIGAARYSAISLNNVAYVPPSPPSPGPIYGTNHPSYAQIEEAKRIHRVGKWEYKVYHMVVEILKRMLLAAIHKNYKQQFWTDDFQYVCTLDQLLHSLAKYRVKTSKELADNKSNMLKPWDISKETIHAFLVRLNDGRRFDPSIPEASCVRETVDIICANDGFATAYESWAAKATADKTWDNLVVHFIEADDTRIAMLALRRVTTPYPGAAYSATTPGSNTPPSETQVLKEAIGELTKEMKKLVRTAASTSTTSANNASTTTTSTTNNNNTPRNNPAPGGREPTATEAGNMTYCWSHGFCFKNRRTGQDVHTSANCKQQHPGHKVDATAANQLGGECRIINSWRPDFRIFGNGE